MTFRLFNDCLENKNLIQTGRMYNVYLFTTSNAEPDVDPIVFVIEPAVKNSIFR